MILNPTLSSLTNPNEDPGPFAHGPHKLIWQKNLDQNRHNSGYGYEDHLKLFLRSTLL